MKKKGEIKMKKILNNNFQSLEEMDWITEKCVRCNMCKFPPLARVESKDYSIGCPWDKSPDHLTSNVSRLIGRIKETRKKVSEYTC